MHGSPQQGSALITVILVLLVLSAIGMAMITMTEQERSTTYDEMYARQALYAAESGLRVGERVLLGFGGDSADAILQHASSATATVVPPAVPQDPGDYTLTNLGTFLATQAGVELVNQEVATTTGPLQGPQPQLFYTLYVRNNPTDISVADNDGGASSLATEDNDSVVNLVAVGWAQFGTVRAVKILEEEYVWPGIAEAISAQKLADMGGTSSGQFGG